jgi:hypothetical protein
LEDFGMRSIRTRIAALLAVVALVVAVPAASVEASFAPAAIAAKSCSAGYTHAVMPDRSHKCLRAGQYCSHKRGWQRVYHRHDFHCKRNGRLTYY